jgi:hypothetical protein
MSVVDVLVLNREILETREAVGVLSEREKLLVMK